MPTGAEIYQTLEEICEKYRIGGLSGLDVDGEPYEIAEGPRAGQTICVLPAEYGEALEERRNRRPASTATVHAALANLGPYPNGELVGPELEDERRLMAHERSLWAAEMPSLLERPIDA